MIKNAIGYVVGIFGFLIAGIMLVIAGGIVIVSVFTTTESLDTKANIDLIWAALTLGFIGISFLASAYWLVIKLKNTIQNAKSAISFGRDVIATIRNNEQNNQADSSNQYQMNNQQSYNQTNNQSYNNQTNDNQTNNQINYNKTNAQKSSTTQSPQLNLAQKYMKINQQRQFRGSINAQALKAIESTTLYNYELQKYEDEQQVNARMIATAEMLYQNKYFSKIVFGIAIIVCLVIVGYNINIIYKCATWQSTTATIETCETSYANYAPMKSNKSNKTCLNYKFENVKYNSTSLVRVHATIVPIHPGDTVSIAYSRGKTNEVLLYKEMVVRFILEAIFAAFLFWLTFYIKEHEGKYKEIDTTNYIINQLN